MFFKISVNRITISSTKKIRDKDEKLLAVRPGDDLSSFTHRQFKSNY